LSDLKTKFVTLFGNYRQLPKQVLDDVYNLLTITPALKGKTVAVEGRYDTRELFLLEGIAALVMPLKPHGDVVCGFYTAPAVILPCPCRTVNLQNHIAVVALTNCMLAVADNQSLEKIRGNIEPYFQAIQLIASCETQKMLYWQAVLKTMDGSEKLSLLRQAFPCIENYIPHSHIASFLGITEVSLSRLRKNKPAVSRRSVNSIQ